MRFLLFTAVLAVSCLAQPPAPAPNAAYRAIVKEAQEHVKRVDTQRFRELLAAHPDLTLVDVRETEEWTAGHAAGAVHISKGLIEHDIEARFPDKGAFLVLYCHSGSRSALAAESLTRMGYANVYSLDGGLAAYQAAGLPAAK